MRPKPVKQASPFASKEFPRLLPFFAWPSAPPLQARTPLSPVIELPFSSLIAFLPQNREVSELGLMDVRMFGFGCFVRGDFVNANLSSLPFRHTSANTYM